ncbi:Rid family hydrolase [Nocardia sp. NPDC059239]|uniref:Rid family hydrolase n=1 Tax=unclassified Nocardia TaxID=2637762 RepID=UPI0036789E62
MPPSSEAPYSRAVRAGEHAWTSGAVGLDNEGHVVGSDTYTQARVAFAGAVAALADVGMLVSDVVQVRVYLTPESDWAGAARAYKETFGEVRPAATMVRVHSLALPELLIEVEARAAAAESRSRA